MQSVNSIRLALISLFLAMLVAPAARASETTSDTSITPDDTLVYVGTYTGDGKSKGIYLFKLAAANLDAPQNATLVPLGLAAEIANPSFVAIDRQNLRLFAVTESGQFRGKPTGAVSAFSIDPATGKLTLINQHSSMGSGPCHLALDRTGRHVFVANYGSGSVAVLPINKGGRLGEATDFVQHEGKSVNPQRQEGPHAHCVTLDPAGRFLFVCDLGLDKVFIYQFDAAAGQLTPHDPPSAAVKPGAGPRHMVFRPDGRYAYVINELDSTIAAFAYDAESGRLTELQAVSTPPENFDGTNSTAEIDIHPSGKYLYGSNRGHNSIVIFAIDEGSGKLSYVDHQSTGGETPRHFGLDPSGKLLAVGNQASDTILVCRIDDATGRLQPAGEMAAAPTPVCVLFLPPATLDR